MQKRFVFSLQLLWSVCHFSCIYALVYRFDIPLIWLPRTLLYFHSTCFSSQVFQWTYHGGPLGRIMLFHFLVVYLLGFSNVWIMFIYIKSIQSWRVCKRNVLYIQWSNLSYGKGNYQPFQFPLYYTSFSFFYINSIKSLLHELFKILNKIK